MVTWGWSPSRTRSFIYCEGAAAAGEDPPTVLRVTPGLLDPPSGPHALQDFPWLHLEAFAIAAVRGCASSCPGEEETIISKSLGSARVHVQAQDPVWACAPNPHLLKADVSRLLLVLFEGLLVLIG